MRPEDAKKLLGGYATGTLTEAEQEALFAAALEDQELFDAVAREQSLRDVLGDPAVKAELLAALEERPARWWSWRPAAAVLAMAGLAAVAVVIVRQKTPGPLLVADVRVQEPSRPEAAPTTTLPDRPASPTRERRKAVSRQQASTAVQVDGQAMELPHETQGGFQRQMGVGGGRGGAAPARAMPAAPPPAMEAPAAPSPARAAPPPAPPPTPVLSLLPTKNTAPVQTQMKAQAEAAATPSARDLFYGTSASLGRVQAVADMAVRRTMALRYTVLRKEGADFVEADPENLKQDDTIALRFTANTNGFLSIDGATPIAITGMQPYTTAAIEGSEVTVVFSRTPQTTAAGNVVTERRERETYVVNPLPAPAIRFPIALKRK